MSHTQQVEKMVPQEGTTHFGAEGLKNPTPQWAIYTFRAEFVLNKVVGIWLASTQMIQNPAIIKEIILWVTIIDAATWLSARFVGVKKSDIESQLS